MNEKIVDESLCYTVVLVSDDVGEDDVLDLGGVDTELLVDFDEEVEGEDLVVEGRSSSAHERSGERCDVLLGSREEILLAVGDVVAEGSLGKILIKDLVK